jgi:hypothetical protein
MNEFKILWIDDDWGNSSSYEYKYLYSVKAELEENEHLKVSIESNIAQGFATVGNHSDTFDLIIIDLNFGSMYDRIWNELVEAILKKGIQFAIYTNHRKTYNNDLKDIREKCRDYLVDIYDKSEKNKFISEIIQISNFNPITLVHLCDFHYDFTLKNKAEKSQNTMFQNLVDFMSEEHKSTPIDFYIFSGDFAAKNPLTEFDAVATYLKEMVNKTNNDIDKLLLIPGNHDVHWLDYEKGILSKEPGLPSKLFYEKIFDRSLNFISTLSGYMQMGLNTKELDSFCFSKKIKNGQIRILGLNSVPLNTELKGYGNISDVVIKYIKNQWSQNPTPNEFRIATFHHNVLPSFSINPHCNYPPINFTKSAV